MPVRHTRFLLDTRPTVTSVRSTVCGPVHLNVASGFSHMPIEPLFSYYSDRPDFPAEGFSPPRAVRSIGLGVTALSHATGISYAP